VRRPLVKELVHDFLSQEPVREVGGRRQWLVVLGLRASESSIIADSFLEEPGHSTILGGRHDLVEFHLASDRPVRRNLMVSKQGRRCLIVVEERRKREHGADVHFRPPWVLGNLDTLAEVSLRVAWPRC